jgi:putative ABC transport system permease protein
VIRNIRYALRMLGKNPGFTAVAVLTLALGIGANTAIFSLVNSLLLRPLPYEDPDRLVALDLINGSDVFPWSYPMFDELRRDQRTFRAVAGFFDYDVNLTGINAPERVRCELVSAAYFPLLGVDAKLGRVFRAEEDREPDGHPLALIGYNLWRQKFGRDAAIVGQTIHLNLRPYTVLGVMPPDFRGQSGDINIWVPITMSPSLLDVPNRLALAQNFWLRTIARLDPGISLVQARAQMEALSRAIEKAYPHPRQMADWRVQPTSLAEAKTDPAIRKSILIMFAAVGFVLLIACVNVANLLLGRAISRQKEVAVRLALGASRRTLIGQFLTESVMLGLAGGLGGFFIAAYAIALTAALRPEASEGFWAHYARAVSTETIRIDAWVVGFNLAVAILTGLLFGLLPALQASKLDLNQALKNMTGGWSRGFRGLRGLDSRSVLIVAEMALAIVLLAGAGLMIESFARLLTTRLGATTDHILTAEIELPRMQYPQTAHVQFDEQLLERIAAMPGVQAASIYNSLPARPQFDVTLMNLGAENGTEAVIGVHSVSADYFRVFRIPFRSGRNLSDHDRAGAQKVLLVNETAARRLWPGQNPIGKHVWLKVWDTGQQEAEVIGVVGDVRYESLEKPADNDVYVSFRQYPETANVAVRTAGDPMALVPTLTRTVHALDKDLPVYGVKTMDQQVADANSRARFSTVLLSAFAAVALLLAGIGLYGVVAFSVAARTREIGIRMALGARREEVMRLVMGDGLILCGVGVALGLPLALAATRVLTTFLYGTKPGDPIAFAGISVLLAAVAALASYIPARRATKVDPLVALRYE